MSLAAIDLPKIEEAWLIDMLLHYKNQGGYRGIDITRIRTKRHLNIHTPWDLFEFCRVNNIWLQARQFDDGYLYYGIRLKLTTLQTPE